MRWKKIKKVLAEAPATQILLYKMPPDAIPDGCRLIDNFLHLGCDETFMLVTARYLDAALTTRPRSQHTVPKGTLVFSVHMP